MKTILHLGLEAPPPKENETIISYPVIRIVPRPPSSPDIVNILNTLHTFDAIIFTSKSAVDLFFALQPAITAPHNKKWIAVGTATAKRLNENGIHTVATAIDETAEGVVTLIDTLSLPTHTRFLWPHSALARRIIPNALAIRGFPLEECILYDTELQAPSPKPDLATIDEIIFTSPSTIDGFLLAFGTLPKDKALRTIGPVTAAALKNVADILDHTDTLS